MIGYKHPCRYCDEFIPPDSNVCPLCGRANPLRMRCPKCRDLIRRSYANCGHCGLQLTITCPYCGESTFFDDYCDECDTRLLMMCSNEKCMLEQPPVGEVCSKCGKPLQPIEKGGQQ